MNYIFLSVLVGTIIVLLIMPWFVFAFEKYFKWCAKKQKELENGK